MPKITRDQVKVPADVLADVRETYVDNYMKATRGTGRLMLFACDQKVEHLNKDFYGEGIDIADAELWHYFPEMMRLAPQCRFYNCTHVHEPGCAVREAVERGEISWQRYESYLKMLDDDDKYRK